MRGAGRAPATHGERGERGERDAAAAAEGGAHLPVLSERSSAVERGDSAPDSALELMVRRESAHRGGGGGGGGGGGVGGGGGGLGGGRGGLVAHAEQRG